MRASQKCLVVHTTYNLVVCYNRYLFKPIKEIMIKLENLGNNCKFTKIDDDDQEDFRHHGGEAYMNLMNKRSKKTRQSDWMKRNRKILNFCHKFCFAFVIISGFMVLITLTWLHFSLRSQTQDLNAQLHQGYYNYFFKY